MAEEQTTVYVIELRNGEGETGWYVGITDDPERRFKQHRSGNGSDFTKEHEIVDMHTVGRGGRGVAERIEDQLTLSLMHEYGRGAVQGGKYSRSSTRGHDRDRTKAHMPAWFRPLVEDHECEGLQRVGESCGVSIRLPDRLKFKTEEDMVRWAHDMLPEGTEVTADKPVDGGSIRYVVDESRRKRNGPDIDHGDFTGIRGMTD